MHSYFSVLYTWFILQLSFSKSGGVPNKLHIYPLCGIFYFLWHRQQGQMAFSISSERHWSEWSECKASALAIRANCGTLEHSLQWVVDFPNDLTLYPRKNPLIISGEVSMEVHMISAVVAVMDSLPTAISSGLTRGTAKITNGIRLNLSLSKDNKWQNTTSPKYYEGALSKITNGAKAHLLHWHKTTLVFFIRCTQCHCLHLVKQNLILSKFVPGHDLTTTLRNIQSVDYHYQHVK